MIGVELVYRLAGVLLGVVAVATLADRSHATRWASGVFWGAYALTLLAGSRLPDFVNGCLVIVLAVVGGTLRLGRGDYRTSTGDDRRKSAARFENRLFLPALIIPLGTLALTLGARHVSVSGVPLVDPKNVSLVALGFSAAVALVVATRLLAQPAWAPIQEPRRLLDLIGWAAVLPQMLAALGALFASAGVGDRIAELLERWLPLGSPFVVVCVYTSGMALFTIILGNAFAAFPIMTAAVGLPLIVRRFGGDPAAMAAIGMLSGFCGTLMTPMAANFNVVPAALLELPDKNAVIRAQLPTALLLLSANTALMYVLVFR
jgi:uncharacterized membrane protein